MPVHGFEESWEKIPSDQQIPPGTNPQCDVHGCVLESRAEIRVKVNDEDDDPTVMRICLSHAAVFELIAEAGKRVDLATAFIYALSDKETLYEMIAFQNQVPVDEVRELCQPVSGDTEVPS